MSDKLCRIDVELNAWQNTLQSWDCSCPDDVDSADINAEGLCSNCFYNHPDYEPDYETDD